MSREEDEMDLHQVEVMSSHVKQITLRIGYIYNIYSRQQTLSNHLKTLSSSSAASASVLGNRSLPYTHTLLFLEIFQRLSHSFFLPFHRRNI